MKAHEFAVIIAGSAVLFFGGALIVGTQFMKKTYEYGSEWVEATDEKEGRRRAEENRRARGAARKASRGGAGNGGGNPHRARKTGRNPQPSRRRSVRAQDLSRGAEPDGRRAAAYRRHSAHQKRNHGVGNRRRRQKNQHLFLTFPRRIPSRRGDGNALRRRFRLRRENRRRGA